MSSHELRISTTIYSVGAVFRTCYKFTDRCFLFLRPDGSDGIIVELRPRPGGPAITEVAGLFSNELIDQHLRQLVGAETRAVREAIVAQAFAEASFDAASG